MQFGFGIASITPQGGKVAIAGRIPTRLTDQVHDDIKAAAMIVDSGKNRSIWVCCDMCHPTAVLTQEVANELAKRISDFHKDQLILSATHSSACTRLVNDYLTISELSDTEGMLSFEEARRQVRDGIVNAVMCASQRMTQCSMSFAKADIITGLCRRVLYSNGKVTMYGKTNREDFVGMEYPDSGPTQILYFHSVKDNALVGIFVSVPCPAQADESSEYLTGDYWHTVRQRIKSAFGENVVVVGACASAGELAPRRLYGSCYYSTKGSDRAVELGNQIADSIIAKEKNVLRVYSEAELSHKRISLQLDFPVKQTTLESVKAADEYFQNPENFDSNGKPVKPVECNKHKYSRKIWQSGKTIHTAQISALKIADVLFYTAPVELYTAYAKRINSRFPDHPVFDVQLTNDNMGYLPTAEAIEHGGYSTFNFNTLTGPEGGELLVSTVKKLLNELVEQG